MTRHSINYRCEIARTTVFSLIEMGDESAIFHFLRCRSVYNFPSDNDVLCFCFQIIRHFIEVVNLMRKEQCIGPVSWSTAVKFLCARKFDVARAVALYEQHEATRYREGLTSFDPSVDPLKTELETEKFTILVRYCA